ASTRAQGLQAGDLDQRRAAHECLQTLRQEINLKDSGGTVLAVVDYDDVRASRLLDPQVVRHWRELEVEVVDGDPDLLDEAEQVLARAGARPASSASKLAQAIGDD